MKVQHQLAVVVLSVLALPAGAVQYCFDGRVPLNELQTGGAAPDLAAAVIGVSPADIHQRFAGVIEQNMRSEASIKIHGDTKHKALSPVELANLAALYNFESGASPRLLHILASSLDADGLTLVAAAFGQEATAAAVKQYASPAVALAFQSSPLKPAQQPTVTKAIVAAAVVGGVGAMGPSPNPDMTIYEIYLEYRTAPVGSLSVGSALAETAVYVGTRVAGWAGAGYEAGVQINNFVNAYMPELGAALDQDVASGASFLQSAWQNPRATILSIGKAEFQLDSGLVGSSIGAEPEDSAGDWNDTFDMEDYSSSIGC